MWEVDRHKIDHVCICTDSNMQLARLIIINQKDNSMIVIASNDVPITSSTNYYY